MSARDAILARLARAHGASGVAGDRDDYLRRHRRGPLPRLAGDLAQRFSAQAKRLASDVVHAATLADVPAAVAAYLREGELPMRMVCWPDLVTLAWRGAGIDAQARPVRRDDPVGITSCFAAIAETGTLLLLSGPETPATVSLLPETHVAVVEQTQIVATMEDAWDRLRTAHGHLPRAVTFISGPSRTADIEQTVTLGAHGPSRVVIVVVDSVPADAPTAPSPP